MRLPLSPRSIAILQALFVTFLWSTSWVLIKYGLQDVPPLIFAGLRYVLALIILLPIALRRYGDWGRKRLTPSDWKRLAVLGLLYYSVTQGAQFVALAILPAVTISLLLNFTTVIVAFFGIVFLSEKPRRLQWIGTALFVLGAVAFFHEDLTQSDMGRSTLEMIGFAVAIAGVLANALSSVLGRGINRSQNIPALLVTVISMGIGAVVLLIAGLIFHGLPGLRPSSWLIIVWLAVVNTALAFTMWNHTLRTLSAMESSIINSTMLIQIAVLAWIFLGERLSALQLLGLLLAALGTLAVQLRRIPTLERASVGTRELP